ncbi:hypothetical protein [Erythrobacter sp. R86502]|uniref:hypothetical protein n=1 Tax=Erythrobacter sp. R86502 TaxID=3093846 RepID=UPI0036D245CD
MTDPGVALAEAARSLIGSRYRLHGRNSFTGLDCVGLVVAALRLVGEQPVSPSGYSLRNLDISQWLPLASQSGLSAVSGIIKPGTILLLRLAHCQHHLVIAADRTNAIHAHAGLRRVVLQPIDPTWTVRAQWQRAVSIEG